MNTDRARLEHRIALGAVMRRLYGDGEGLEIVELGAGGGVGRSFLPHSAGYVGIETNTQNLGQRKGKSGRVQVSDFLNGGPLPTGSLVVITDLGRYGDQVWKVIQRAAQVADSLVASWGNGESEDYQNLSKSLFRWFKEVELYKRESKSQLGTILIGIGKGSKWST